MANWTNRRVLITQKSLFSIAGSEVVAYELAEFFSVRGAEVTVATCGFSNTWKEHFDALANTTLLRLDDPRVAARIAANPPDLAWIQHQIIPQQLLMHPGATIFLFHHMSAFLAQEFPLHHRVEAALASAVLFPAEETLDAHRASHLLDGVDAGRLSVLGNPAPDRFWADAPPVRARMRRLLLVSNHIPEELAAAIEGLPQDCEVVVRGEEQAKGAVSRLVQPEELTTADAVITIGKTVQYALAAGVPVYCYDRFGGPGWLSPQNVALARHNNFSGRGFTTRTAEDIAEELVDGFAGAATDATHLHDTIAREFLLSATVDRVTDALTPHTIQPISVADLAAFTLSQDVTNGLTNALAARDLTITAHEMTIEHTRTLLHLAEAKIERVSAEALQLTEALHTSESLRNARLGAIVRARLAALKHRLTSR